jgi:hypothetical protein
MIPLIEGDINKEATEPSALRQQPFSCRGAGIFIVLVKKISEPSSVKIFFFS